MIVVGPLDNDNGMATWCWEAAHALHRAGRHVVLAVAPHASIPGDAEMEVVHLREARQLRSGSLRLLMKVLKLLYPIARPRADGSLLQLHTDLIQSGRQPSIYLLNRTTMVDKRVATPQYVVAWAYPVSLHAYLAKTGVMVQSTHPLARPRMFLWILGNWREDWRAYRQAVGTLAVTSTLSHALCELGVSAFRLHPSTRVPDGLCKPTGTTRRILIAAALLDEPRKRVAWMLQALAGAEGFKGCELLLVGVASPTIAAAAAHLPFPVTLTGRLRRDELQSVMAGSDILCFASKMDDWGYVAAEAVANGLLVLAPKQSPFDEIVGTTGLLFEPWSASSFTDCLRNAIQMPNSELYRRKQEARQHAEDTFSDKVFARTFSEITSLHRS